MTRLLLASHFAVIAVTASTTTVAQTPLDPPRDHYGHLLDHDYWHHDRHAPDVAALDQHSDRLAKIARHLHEDAHGLSQDYQHSAAIEGYVDQIDRLQQHLHQILHEAVESGTQSTVLIEHARSDTRQVKSWLNRLYMELQHQGFDGARTSDYHAMIHMRQIIVHDAFPLVRLLEAELYGHWSLDDHWTVSHDAFFNPGIGPDWTLPGRIRVHH